MAYYFWNAPGTIAYIRYDNSNDDAVGSSDTWVALGISRGSIRISGSPQFDNITSDTHQSSSFPAEKIFLGSELSIELELAKQSTPTKGILDDDLPNFGVSTGYPAMGIYGFGRISSGNQPVLDSGGAYNLLLWSQVDRNPGGTPAVTTKYVCFWRAIPDGFDWSWGTKASYIPLRFRCTDTFSNGVGSPRQVASHGHTNLQALGPPPSILP